MINSGVQKVWPTQESIKFVVESLEKADSRDQESSIYADLLELTNTAYTVRFILNQVDPQLLDRLRCLRADYVFSLEAEWARKITTGNEDLESMHRIQYFSSYHKMVETEVEFLRNVLKRPIKKVIFVGSGPFPFSSYCMVKEFGIRVTNIDIDHEALETSKELAKALGIVGGIEYVCCDARNMVVDPEADAVVVAALVGHHPIHKHEIINSLGLKLNENQVLAARTARDMKQLFYVGVDRSEVNLQYLGTSKTPKEVINSLMVFKRR